MNIKPFQAIYPNFDYIASADSFFGTVKHQYPEYKKNGFFQKAAQESFYIYEISSPERTYTGLMACSDINDYFEGRIKRHENTLTSQEQMQMQLILSRNATVKPVLQIYPEVEEINAIIRKHQKETKNFFSITFDEGPQIHTFWEISDGQAIQHLQKLFLEKVPHTYIADGHHRTSTTALLHKRFRDKGRQQYDLLLSAFFTTSEIQVHDFNRIIIGLDEISSVQFMAKLSRYFNMEIIAGPGMPTQKHELTLFIKKEWLRLRWRPEIIAEYLDTPVLLDANLLNEKVLHEMLGIEDVRGDHRVKYVGGPGSIEKVKQKTIQDEHRVGFCLYPVALDDLIHTADLGLSMPPKSTWFEPRMRNGLIVYDF